MPVQRPAGRVRCAPECEHRIPATDLVIPRRPAFEHQFALWVLRYESVSAFVTVHVVRTHIKRVRLAAEIVDPLVSNSAPPVQTVDDHAFCLRHAELTRCKKPPEWMVMSRCCIRSHLRAVAK